jgi:hypothetical protein
MTFPSGKGQPNEPHLLWAGSTVDASVMPAHADRAGAGHKGRRKSDFRFRAGAQPPSSV